MENDSREALSRHISEARLRVQHAEEEYELRCLRELQQAAEARRIEKARIEREAREVAERAAREEARRQREEEARRVAQRSAEERLGVQTVHANSTRCPACTHFVQKSSGWYVIVIKLNDEPPSPFIHLFRIYLCSHPLTVAFVGSSSPTVRSHLKT